MKITFGLNLNSAEWSESPAALGEIRFGPERMLSFLQTRLGLGGNDEPAVLRIDQYRRRLAAVIAAASGAVWFQKSFELDPWSTAKQLLSWRDELVLAGWNRSALPAGFSKRLAALSAIEGGTEPLAQGTADKLREVLDELDSWRGFHTPQLCCGYKGMKPESNTLREQPYPDRSAVGLVDVFDVSCIQSIELTEPPELLPRLWQLVFNKLGAMGVPIKEAPPQAPITLLEDSLVLLEADTEWEAAEALAMWLAADKDANKKVNMIVPGASGVLGTALHRLGLPRTGSGESSKWRAHLQILPLVFSNAWQPIELGALVSLLTLPISPVPSDVRYWLLRALKNEAGVKGAAWEKSLEEITKQYAAPKNPARKAKTEQEIDEILKTIDNMLVTGRYPAGGIPEAAITERCNWIIKSLTPQC
ncbi:MAG: hypothetical protein LBQ38_09830, partial [Spirochaetaceae bacterium]|nr:hypothetical protein [Spirochaetaceae bacterium]